MEVHTDGHVTGDGSNGAHLASPPRWARRCRWCRPSNTDDARGQGHAPPRAGTSSTGTGPVNGHPKAVASTASVTAPSGRGDGHDLGQFGERRRHRAPGVLEVVGLGHRAHELQVPHAGGQRPLGPPAVQHQAPAHHPGRRRWRRRRPWPPPAPRRRPAPAPGRPGRTRSAPSRARPPPRGHRTAPAWPRWRRVSRPAGHRAGSRLVPGPSDQPRFGQLGHARRRCTRPVPATPRRCRDRAADRCGGPPRACG